MSKAMIHWNGNQLCVIDTETTGLIAGYHELIQICILPLDSNIEPRKDVYPFYLEIIPEHPERADPQAMKINRLDFAKLAQRGHHPDKAADLLEEWIDKLGLPQNTYSRKKIIPLGQNYPFDMSFIKAWIGDETYNEHFHYSYRDTKAVANYLNDRAAMHAEKVPYSKTSLGWLAKQHSVEHINAHDALADCQTTAKVYKMMIKQGLLG